MQNKTGAKFVCATVLFYKNIKSEQVRGEKGLNPETVL